MQPSGLQVSPGPGPCRSEVFLTSGDSSQASVRTSTSGLHLLLLIVETPSGRESGAPLAGTRGTYGTAEPAEAPALLSILRSGATAEDGRQGFRLRRSFAGQVGGQAAAISKREAKIGILPIHLNFSSG